MKRILVFLFVGFIILGYSGKTSAFNYNIFTDVTFTGANGIENDMQDESNRRSFILGEVDVFFVERVSDRIDTMGEVVIMNHMGDWHLDVERIQIGYMVSDLLHIKVGRFHNIIGYWNTHFHHGTHLQTTIQRPDFLSFHQGGVLHAHLVGLKLGGRTKGATIISEYGLIVSNGSKIEDPGNKKMATLDPLIGGDNDRNKAVSLNLRIRPTVLPDLGIGLSGMMSKVEGREEAMDGMSVSPKVDVDQTILGADISFSNSKIEFIGEYYRIKDKDNMGTNMDYSSDLFFVQGGYTFKKKVNPFIRYEHSDIDDTDDYFNDNGLNVKSYTKTVAGIRYMLTLKSSLKAEYRVINRDTEDKFSEYAIQWTVSF